MSDKIIIRMKDIALLCLAFFITIAPAMAGTLNLSVAASLKEVINKLTARYTEKHPSTVFARNFGSSGTLAGQIENGAPADLFISANTKWMEYLKEKALVDGASEKTLAFNSLVFVGTTKKNVSSMNDLPALERIAIGSPKSVPAGEYAMAAIKESGMETKLDGKLVMAKDVKECLMYADIGEVDGAFVYRTDALQAQKAKRLFVVPQALYPRVVYSMALTTQALQNSEAKAFEAYLQGAEAESVLREAGFVLE